MNHPAPEALSEMDADRVWHIDKRVPLALLFAIGMQTCAALWWAAGITARVDVLERAQIDAPRQTERLIRVETKVDSMQDDVKEIKRLLNPVTPPREGR